MSELKILLFLGFIFIFSIDNLRGQVSEKVIVNELAMLESDSEAIAASGNENLPDVGSDNEVSATPNFGSKQQSTESKSPVLTSRNKCNNLPD